MEAVELSRWIILNSSIVEDNSSILGNGILADIPHVWRVQNQKGRTNVYGLN